MDEICEAIERQRNKTPALTTWEEIEDVAISDPRVSTHSGTTRKTWVGDHVVLTRAVVKANSVGKPHRHEAEQVSMILRGRVLVTLEDRQFEAGAGSIVFVPRNAVHMFQILDEETELLDAYGLKESASELAKEYPGT